MRTHHIWHIFEGLSKEAHLDFPRRTDNENEDEDEK